MAREKQKTIVAKAADLPPGRSISVNVSGRDIAVFNVGGEFFAVGNRCPHEGAALCKGTMVRLVESDQPGEYRVLERELLRCPWHGWEFDLKTGQSWCDPAKVRVPNYAVSVEAGAELVKGPYTIDTFPISVENDYVVVEA